MGDAGDRLSRHPCRSGAAHPLGRVRDQPQRVRLAGRRGLLFFQDAPSRAFEWARQRFGDQAAVIGAEIDLEDCIDFLDVEWQEEVKRAYERYRALLEQEARPLPRQTRGAHRLDRSVINYLVALLSDRGIRVKSVRAAFGEGVPVFAHSALLDRSHVQIAVRDSTAILRTWRLA